MNRYIRKGTYAIDAVLSNIQHMSRADGKKNKVNFDGTLVNMANVRYSMFLTKGIACVECGIVGEHFALERVESDKNEPFHFNLYAFDKNGNEVVMTKDHIIPRALGGEDGLSNLQPMCAICNGLKGIGGLTIEQWLSIPMGKLKVHHIKYILNDWETSVNE